MDRCAIFVDAGYLYAEGGKLCGVGPARSGIELDAGGATGFLVGVARSSCDLPPLRTYWYDGAKDGVPTRDQQRIAALPNVKLRLGRINAQNQQKGVDALIYRDLMTLARERAISDAFLLSGDEDLREGVKATQDMGVRVTLIGIETSEAWGNQSKELRNEADEVVILAEEHLRRFIARRQIPREHSTISRDLASAVSDAAAAYAKQWMQNATRDECESLLASDPRIPRNLDASLLAHVEDVVHESLRQRDDLRQTARRAFWNRVRSAQL